MLLQALAGISLFLFSLFLFSLFSLPVQKATLGRAGPAVKLQMLLQALAGSISLSLFSFLFTGSESNVRHGRSRLQTLQMLPQALAGISLFLFSLFLFSLFSLPVQKATLGRAGPAVKRYNLSFSFLFSLYASAGPRRYLSLSLFFSLFLFSLFSLPVQTATLGTAGPALKRYKCFRRPLQVSISFSFLSFSFLFSLYRFRKQR